ncbi:MAG: response regulator transcription factor, partial [Actinobacteria bacterium]|nr:response regulator transcription factor [Actinomycetota bacterium]
MAMNGATVNADARNMKILLVDDHDSIRRSIRQLIELKDEFEVVGEGCNGSEAIDQVGALRPDIVLMDMNMPVMDGVQATRVIKQRHPEIQVLALTAFADMSLV